MSSAGPEFAGIHEAAGRIIVLLTAREQTVAVAESLTGGLLAAALTSIPGASAAFRGAVVAYATSLKATLLDVPRPMLDALGAVSPEVAAAMAGGRDEVRQRTVEAVLSLLLHRVREECS